MDETQQDPAWEVGGYVAEQLLGYGGTGEVWRGRRTSGGAPVALKRLRSGAGPVAAAQLRREARALAAVDSPHLVRLHEVLEQDGETVLVLDLAEGGALAGLLLARGRLDPGEVVTVAVPLARALAAVHDAGLLHGDVTPANVLLTGAGMPLLADLGLSRAVARDRAEAGQEPVQGTAEYADPAVADGQPPTPAADVFALAAVCHHALSGSPPHGGGAPGRMSPEQQVLAAVRAGGRAPLGLLAPHVPRALVAAVEAALVPDPAARPDAATFAASLRRACAATPVRLEQDAHLRQGEAVRPTHHLDRPLAPPPPPPPPRRRRPRPGERSRRGLAVLAVLVGLLGAGATALAARTALSSWRPVAATTAAPAVTAPATAAPAGTGTAAAGPVAGSPLPAAAPAPPSPPEPPPRSQAPDATAWRQVLDGLDAAREAAFTTADVAALAGVHAPGSPALLADTRTVEALAQDGRTAVGVRHAVQAVRVVRQDGLSATLAVRTALGPQQVRGPDGAVLVRYPARPAAEHLTELVRTPDGWRLRRVVRR